MIQDILTVMWKERKGLLSYRGSRLRGAMMLLIPALIAVILPLKIGEGFAGSPLVLILPFIVPVRIIAATIPDSFAGERERHTLETLLASRLSDRAILFGKIATPVVFAWIVLAGAHTLALTVFNVAHWNGSLQVHPPTILLGVVGFGLLLPLVVAGLGVIISLRAATLQGAAQLLGTILMPMIVLPLVGAVVVIGGRDQIETVIEALETANWTAVLAVVLAVLLVVAVLFLTTAMARFQRTRLILD